MIEIHIQGVVVYTIKCLLLPIATPHSFRMSKAFKGFLHDLSSFIYRFFSFIISIAVLSIY